jgi:hypothetical protein
LNGIRSHATDSPSQREDQTVGACEISEVRVSRDQRDSVIDTTLGDERIRERGAALLRHDLGP